MNDTYRSIDPPGFDPFKNSQEIFCYEIVARLSQVLLVGMLFGSLAFRVVFHDIPRGIEHPLNYADADNHHAATDLHAVA